MSSRLQFPAGPGSPHAKKYADNRIADIEDPKVLELQPFDRLGSKTHIRRGIFGGPENFSKALSELDMAMKDILRETALSTQTRK